MIVIDTDLWSPQAGEMQAHTFKVQAPKVIEAQDAEFTPVAPRPYHPEPVEVPKAVMVED